MNYLTYEEYVSIGGILDTTAFSRNIDRTCSVIDNATFNRVHDMAEVPQKVKVCCRDLVEYIATNKAVNEKSVASWSESAGAVSESVSYTTKTEDEMQSDTQSILYDYLYMLKDDRGTPLMYKGALA